MLELLPSELLEPLPPEAEGWLTAAAFDVLAFWPRVRPWKVLAAATESPAERATAPAMSQRLMRPTSAKPRSRVVSGEVVISCGAWGHMTPTVLQLGPRSL